MLTNHSSINETPIRQNENRFHFLENELGEKFYRKSSSNLSQEELEKNQEY